MEAQYLINAKRPYEMGLLNINKLMFKSAYDLENVLNHRLAMFELLDKTDCIRRDFKQFPYAKDWSYALSYPNVPWGFYDPVRSSWKIIRGKRKHKCWFISN